jgi:hypothetical protein
MDNSNRTGTFAYAVPFNERAVMPTFAPQPQPVTTTTATITVGDPDWQPPDAEDDLDEAERLFLCAVRRVRKAIRKQRFAAEKKARGGK